jgi:ADP-heptose:LPS heptosyltransferase
MKNTEFLMGPENQRYLTQLGEALLERYPGATVRFPLDGKKPQRFPWCPEHNFVPQPACGAPKEAPDVLVAPRFRAHGAHRNYEHWHEVIDDLEIAGFTVGLLGVKEASLDRPGLPKGFRAWDHQDNLGVTLRWMKKAKLVLCTDSGIAHLAVLAQAPLAVIYGKAGVEAGKEKWRWVFGHMKAHSVARCEAILGGWEDPNQVIGAVLSSVAQPRRPGCRAQISRYAASHSTSAANT